MSPEAIFGASTFTRAETLELVEELKRDISSCLLERPKLSKDEFVDRLTCAGVLCYRRPADSEEDRWGAARSVGGLDDGAAQPPSQQAQGSGQSQGAGSSSGSRAPPPAAASPATTASGSPGKPSGPRQPPCLPLFGAPPHSSQVRWPPRPREDEAFGEPRARGAGARGGTGGRGDDSEGEVEAEDAEESDGSDSGDSEGWEPRPRGGDKLQASPQKRPRSRQALAASPSEGSLGRASPPPVDVNELLEFTSCFESGNLRYVVYSVEDDAYDLVLENDVNTRGHTQWFYFAVRNGRPGSTVRLRIINMSKAKSLFRLGMRPQAWSEARAARLTSELLAAQRAAARGCGGSSSSTSRPVAEAERLWSGAASVLWEPAGEHVQYHRTRADQHGTTGNSYTLAFEYTFEGSQREDCIYFAMAVPFTFSMLRTTLSAISSDPVSRAWCRTKCLCATSGGLRCDLVEISNWSVHKRQKKSVVVSARVHPGESNASWVVHGLLGFLLSPSPEAKVLRDHFIWHVVPMMNPDGVVCGNYRCALCGVDLNRQWRRPSEALHGSVHGLKRLISRAKKKRGLCMYIDLHGHSRKCGLFSYACGQYPKDDYRRFTVRMYPKLLGMLTPEFTPTHCRWRVGKGKRGTGRVVVAKDLGLTETYTIEASFFGHQPPREVGAANAGGGGEGGGEGKDRAAPPEGGAEAPEAAEGQGRPASAAEEPQPGQDVVPFTPAKLEVFGANMARALILHQNLHAQLKLAVQRHGSNPADPWPDIAPAEEPEWDFGSSTPSAASEADAEHSASEEQASEAESLREDAASPELATVEASPTSSGEVEDEEESPMEAAHLESAEGSPCLGIDVEEVMEELQNDHLSEDETDSCGSDSCPSEDKLGDEELAQICRLLKIRQKPLCKKSGGHGSDAKQKRRRSSGHRREDRQERSGRRRGAGQREAMRFEQSLPPRVEAQRIVAFGQTTYYTPELVRSAPDRAGSEPSPIGGRRQPARRSAQPAPGSADLSIGGFSLSSSFPAADRHHPDRPPWPALPHALPQAAPSARREATEQPLLVLGPPRDRFAFPRAAGAASSSSSQAEVRRRRDAGSHASEDAHGSLPRRLHMRNVSSSLLHFGRRQVPEPALHSGSAADDRGASSATFGAERSVPSSNRNSRPVSRQSPRVQVGLPRAGSQRDEASMSRFRRGSEAWGPNTPREGPGSARPQEPRAASTSMPPSLAREGMSPTSRDALRQDLLARRR